MTRVITKQASTHMPTHASTYTLSVYHYDCHNGNMQSTMTNDKDAYCVNLTRCYGGGHVMRSSCVR